MQSDNAGATLRLRLHLHMHPHCWPRSLCLDPLPPIHYEVGCVIRHFYLLLELDKCVYMENFFRHRNRSNFRDGEI